MVPFTAGNMKVAFLKLYDRLSVNLWFIPSITLMLAIGLSILTLELDYRLDFELPKGAGFWSRTGDLDAAREILSIIAGSMITITSITFSITIVSLQLASSQYGPRLIRNFMADRVTQLVLGIFVATFVFNLLVLRGANSTQDSDFVPQISIIVALFSAILAIGFLIYFIHHVAKSIQAEHVIESVCSDLRKSFRSVFPEDLGHAPDEVSDFADHSKSITEPMETTSLVCGQGGYLQTIDSDRILEILVKYDLILHLRVRPGRFILSRSVLAELGPKSRVTEEIQSKLTKTFTLGLTRSPIQDVEFAIDQLVEIAVRALSKGINDPFTAINCVDRLADAINDLTNRSEPNPCRADSQGNIRVVSEIESFEGIAAACFDQIRQAAKEIPAVLIRIVERIIDVAPKVKHQGLRAGLARTVRLIDESCQHIEHESQDLKDIKSLCQSAMKALGNPPK